MIAALVNMFLPPFWIPRRAILQGKQNAEKSKKIFKFTARGMCQSAPSTKTRVRPERGQMKIILVFREIDHGFMHQVPETLSTSAILTISPAIPRTLLAQFFPVETGHA